MNTENRIEREELMNITKKTEKDENGKRRKGTE
jgi:hypothetical protein